MVLRPALILGGLVLAASLGGCATRTPYQTMMALKPTGSAFSRALYSDYAALARSLGLEDLPGRTAFDAATAISLTSIQPDIAATAQAYAAKAESAGNGDEPLPEAAPPDDNQAEAARLALLRALYYGRAKAPVEAARTQAQYDCWVVDGGVPSLAQASALCRRAFMADLAHLRSVPGVMADVPPPSSKDNATESSASE